MNKTEIKDLVIKSHFESFIQTLGYENFDLGRDLTKVFERFINYLILSQVFHKEITKIYIDNISTGDADSGSDSSIDGLVILVDGNIIFCEDDLKKIDFSRRGLEVEFNFIQAKSSARFDKGDINNFLTGVKLFFDSKYGVQSSTIIRKFKRLAECIFEKTNDNIRVNFACRLFYVTTGSWTGERELTDIVDERTKDIVRLGFFSKQNIEFQPIDAKQIKHLLATLRLKISRSIRFKNHISLPDDKNERVQKAYIGIISGDEYLKLICDQDFNLQKMLFQRNVRDFQGSNTVNIEIGNAVNDTELNSMFALLNNGITIVAKSVTTRGQEVFIIEDYQIVNGCQTSHVLYNNREKITNNTWIPIKLIATKDDLVTNAITRATNNQTEIDEEEFESSKPFHIRLEEYYSAYPVQSEQKIYFERRRGQYADNNISKDRIFSIKDQAKCYIALASDEPHSAFTYSVKQYGTRIFRDNDALSLYYSSSYAYHVLDKLFKSKLLSDKLFNFRYHAIWAFKVKHGPLPKRNKADDYSKELLTLLRDQERAQNIFLNIGKEIEECIEEYSSLQTDPDSSSNIYRQKDFTDWLNQKIIYSETKENRAINQNDVVPEIKPQSLSGKLLLTGKIENYDYGKGRGYIKCDTNEALYFFILPTSNSLRSKIQVDQLVKFRLMDQGPLKKVQIVDE